MVFNNPKPDDQSVPFSRIFGKGNTYWARLDGSNMPFTGPITLSGDGQVWKCVDLNPQALRHPTADPPDNVTYQNLTYHAYDDGPT